MFFRRNGSLPLRRRLPEGWLATAAQTLARVAPGVVGARLRSPCFIVGCGRSGTTLLLEAVATHPDVAAYPFEANELWHPLAYPWHESGGDGPPAWIDPRGFAERSLASRSAGDDRYIRAVFAAYQLLFGGQVFLNKSALLGFALPLVVRLFPDARLIHLLRDGRAVALSGAVKQRAKMDETPEVFRAQNLDLPLELLLERFAAYWRENVEEIERQRRALALAERGRWLELRYEDLCGAPEQTLRRVGAFLDLDPGGFRLNAAASIRSENHKFRDRLDAGLRRQLEEMMEPALGRLGYGEGSLT